MLDAGLDITDYRILAMISSPPAWFNYFQHPETLGFVVILSLIIWFLVGLVIDSLIKKIKSSMKEV